MDVISPELALVDKTLAAAARRRLPTPGDCLAPRQRPTEPAAGPSVGDREPHGRVARPSLVIVAAVLLVAGIGFPAADWVRRGSSNGAEMLGPQATAAELRGDGRVTANLTWKPIPAAVAYEFVVRDRSGIVLMLRPVASRVALVLDAVDGRKSLAAGAYRWTVAPILRNRGALRAGPTSARGVLVISA